MKALEHQITFTQHVATVLVRMLGGDVMIDRGTMDAEMDTAMTVAVSPQGDVKLTIEGARRLVSLH